MVIYLRWFETVISRLFQVHAICIEGMSCRRGALRGCMQGTFMDTCDRMAVIIQ